MPLPALPAIRLPAPTPPTVLPAAPFWMWTPACELPRAAVPVTSVPSRLLRTTIPVAPLISTPLPPLPEMRLKPETVLSLAFAPKATPSETLPTLAVPAASVPILLPTTTFPDSPVPENSTPALTLPEIRLAAPAAVPPIVLALAPRFVTWTPSWPLPAAAVPLTSVPM